MTDLTPEQEVFRLTGKTREQRVAECEAEAETVVSNLRLRSGDNPLIVPEQTAAIIELNDQLQEALRTQEAAFRRGYSQAYFAAANDALSMKKNGIARAQEVANVLLDHALKVVLPWRNRGNAGEERVDPPRMDVPNWWLLRHQVFARDGRKCEACHSNRQLEIDHIVPVAEGGMPALFNLRVLCRTCNRARPRK